MVSYLNVTFYSGLIAYTTSNVRVIHYYKVLKRQNYLLKKHIFKPTISPECIITFLLFQIISLNTAQTNIRIDTLRAEIMALLANYISTVSLIRSNRAFITYTTLHVQFEIIFTACTLI